MKVHAKREAQKFERVCREKVVKDHQLEYEKMKNKVKKYKDKNIVSHTQYLLINSSSLKPKSNKTNPKFQNSKNPIKS